MNFELWDAQILVFSVVACWLALFGASVAQEFRIFRHLREHHASVWQELGRPRPLKGLRRDRRARAYFRGGEYRRLDDRALSRMVIRQRVFGWAYAAAFALVLVLLFTIACPS